MIKCLNILKNIGKPIYRSISTCDPIHSDQAALHSCLCACFQMEFEAQMDQVKSGARLCSLPDICVPSVPSVPALPVRAAAHSVGSLKVKGRRLLISVVSRRPCFLSRPALSSTGRTCHFLPDAAPHTDRLPEAAVSRRPPAQHLTVYDRILERLHMMFPHYNRCCSNSTRRQQREHCSALLQITAKYYHLTCSVSISVNCHLFLCIFSIITPVFSVTWSSKIIMTGVMILKMIIFQFLLCLYECSCAEQKRFFQNHECMMIRPVVIGVFCAGWWWASSSRKSVCPAEARSTRWPMMMSSTEWLRSSWTIRRTRVCVTVSFVCVWESVCVCERESVWERERVCVCVRERVCVCVRERVCVNMTPCALAHNTRRDCRRKCRESSDMILRTALLVMCLITSIKVAFKQAIQSGKIYKHRRQVTLGTSASLLC